MQQEAEGRGQEVPAEGLEGFEPVGRRDLGDHEQHRDRHEADHRGDRHLRRAQEEAQGGQGIAVALGPRAAEREAGEERDEDHGQHRVVHERPEEARGHVAEQARCERHLVQPGGQRGPGVRGGKARGEQDLLHAFSGPDQAGQGHPDRHRDGGVHEDDDEEPADEPAFPLRDEHGLHDAEEHEGTAKALSSSIRIRPASPIGPRRCPARARRGRRGGRPPGSAAGRRASWRATITQGARATL